MAGPHVAGVVALMRQACPNCDPTTIKEALLATAIDSGYGATGDDNVYGYGFVDAWAAVNFVYNLGSVFGVVTANGTPVSGVEVEILEDGRTATTAADGSYSLGVSAGNYTLSFTKFGYLPLTISNVTILEGEQTELDPVLTLAPTNIVSGHVYTSTGADLPDALIEVLDAPIPSVTTDGSGSYSLSMPAGNTYTLRATGSRGADRAVFLLSADTTINFAMPQEVHCYIFETSSEGWYRDSLNDTATRGRWGRMNPEQTENNGFICQPEDDHTENGVSCFVTDGNAGSVAGENDVDGGKTSLLSPIWDLSNDQDVVIEMYSWFSNDNGNNPGEDYFDVFISNDAGTTWVSMMHESEDWEEWRRCIFLLEDYVALSDQVQMKIVAQDLGNGSLVEAAVDDICVLASATLPPEDLTIVMLDEGVKLTWRPAERATSYTVWRGTEFPPTTSNTVVVTTVTDTSFVDMTNLDSLGYYFVTANR